MNNIATRRICQQCEHKGDRMVCKDCTWFDGIYPTQYSGAPITQKEVEHMKEVVE